MKNISLKSILPHGIAVIVFFIISFAYFSPQLGGKKLKQGDITQFLGMSKEIKDFKEKTGEHTLWTNSMFGGMPTYLIAAPPSRNVIQYVHRFFSLFGARPANFIFMYLLGFYIALLIFRINPWLSIAGSIAFAFSSYFFIIVMAGHTSKAMAIAYMPPIIAGIYMAFKQNPWLGSFITTIFLSLQLLVNHLQITYYTLLVILIFGILQFTETVKQKTYLPFLKATGLLMVGLMLAVGLNFTSIFTTYEYGKYSMRGKSELSTTDDTNQTSGLDRDYILNDYSYGIAETFNLLIPNFLGGPSQNDVGLKSEFYQLLKNAGQPNAKLLSKHAPTYWGEQRYTAGPVYIGAVVIFLFIFGLFILKGKEKWWLFSATILAILLAWGKHFPVLSNLFIDYFPGYNKFRTVSMILVIAELTMPLVAIFALQKIWNAEITKKDFFRALKYAFYIVGGLTLLFAVVPGAFLSFQGTVDTQLNYPEPLLDALREDRKNLLQADAIRSFVFVSLSAIMLLVYHYKKITPHLFIIGIAALFLLDLWPVNQRYLNNEHFTSAKEAKQPFTPNMADNIILQDKEKNYRVLDLTVSTFNDTHASYFHKSLGGYHGAKMKRYQELVDYHISIEMNSLISTLQNHPVNDSVNATLEKLNALNMLNTKYIIINPNTAPINNQKALGNAWFVEKCKVVANADEEIDALYQFNPKKEAIVDARFKDQLKEIQRDTLASISLVEYKPNELHYQSKANTDQLAVFSEIFYDKGWNAYIDDSPSPHFRANYVLRGMVIPEGEHEIVFKFEPKSYQTGQTVSLVSSILLLLATAGIVVRYIGKR